MLPRWLKIWKMQRDPHHLDGASALSLFCKQCINYMSVQTMGHGSLNAPLHHPCCMTSSWYLHRNHLQCSGGWLSTLSLHGTIFLPWQPCFSYFDSASYCHPRGDVTRHVLMEVVPAVRASHGDAGRQDVEASKWNMEEEHKQELSVCGDMPIPKLKKTRVNTVLRNIPLFFSLDFGISATCKGISCISSAKNFLGIPIWSCRTTLKFYWGSCNV